MSSLGFLFDRKVGEFSRKWKQAEAHASLKNWFGLCVRLARMFREAEKFPVVKVFIIRSKLVRCLWNQIGEWDYPLLCVLLPFRLPLVSKLPIKERVGRQIHRLYISFITLVHIQTLKLSTRNEGKRDKGIYKIYKTHGHVWMCMWTDLQEGSRKWRCML